MKIRIVLFLVVIFFSHGTCSFSQAVEQKPSPPSSDDKAKQKDNSSDSSNSEILAEINKIRSDIDGLKSIEATNEKHMDFIQNISSQVVNPWSAVENVFNVLSGILGVISIVVAISSILAAFFIYRQGKDYKDQLKEQLIKHESSLDKFRELMKEQIETFIDARNADFEKMQNNVADEIANIKEAQAELIKITNDPTIINSNKVREEIYAINQRIASLENIKLGTTFGLAEYARALESHKLPFRFECQKCGTIVKSSDRSGVSLYCPTCESTEFLLVSSKI